MMLSATAIAAHTAAYVRLFTIAIVAVAIVRVFLDVVDITLFVLCTDVLQPLIDI